MKYRHPSLFLLLIVIQVFGISFAAKGQIPFLQDSGAQHIVSIEAENYHDSEFAQDGHQWQEVFDGQYSGGVAMQALPEDRDGYFETYASVSAALTYEVEFVTGGTHYVWVRGLGPQTSSDSLHVGLDGAAVSSAENINRFLPTGTLLWSDESSRVVRKLEVPGAGVHTVNVWMRESGMVFDKLVLTTDANFVPADAGPAESGGGQTETIPTDWDDDFSSNSLAKYEMIPTNTQGGSGQILYDDIGQRLHFSTGADVGIMLNLTIAGQNNGVVNTEFLPSTSYSTDGTFSLRLKQDAENYYEIINTSSGSIGAIDKVVDGEVVESLSINNEFITNKNYHITVNYSPQYTKILAFGDMYVLDINNADINVSHIEIELSGQDGYIDNLRFAEMPSDQYVAMGDSITKASSHDDIDADGTGYEPILSDLLTQAKEYPNLVVNEGVSGDASADGLSLLPGLLNQYSQSRFFLIQYGTNDAWAPVPSGLGLEPGDANYPGTFKDNMQQIIDMIKANGKIPYLAKVPKAFDERSFLNETLQAYNMVIDELVAKNNIGLVPPDFYCHFENHPEEMDDTLHPNGLGYISMANIWFEALMDQYGGCTP